MCNNAMVSQAMWLQGEVCPLPPQALWLALEAWWWAATLDTNLEAGTPKLGHECKEAELYLMSLPWQAALAWSKAWALAWYQAGPAMPAWCLDRLRLPSRTLVNGHWQVLPLPWRALHVARWHVSREFPVWEGTEGEVSIQVEWRKLGAALQTHPRPSVVGPSGISQPELSLNFSLLHLSGHAWTPRAARLGRRARAVGRPAAPGLQGCSERPGSVNDPVSLASVACDSSAARSHQQLLSRMSWIGARSSP